MSIRKKRSTANSTRGASSSLDEELNLSTLLTQGEELPEPSATVAKATYEVELAKLRKEAEELAKAKKRLLVVQHEAEAAKEIQRQKAKIAKLQEELCAIKAKQSVSFNQPSPKYVVPNQSIFTEGNVPFTQPPPYTTFSRNPFVNPFESGPSNHDVHTIRMRSWDPIHLYLKKFRSLLSRNPTGQFHAPDSRVNQTLDNS
jgi:hypothetical protein